MEIRQNYSNYERVTKAFKDFIHALVWESLVIDEGASENEVNEHIEKYCNAHGDQMIALVNDGVRKYITSLYSRYKVTYYECDSEGRIKSIEQVINTDNMEVALAQAAKFYRKGSIPYIEVFDNETKKFIAKWD